MVEIPRPRSNKPGPGRRAPRRTRALPEPSSESRVGVAYVRRAWGTDGSLAVTQYSDDPDRLAPGTRVYLEGNRPAKVVEWHRAGSAIVLRLDAVRDSRDAEALRGTILEMERDDLPSAAPGVYYHFEIIGCAVHTTAGEDLGTITEILDTGANDVYVVSNAGASEDVLVPAVPDVVIDVDIGARLLTVDLPDGLR